MRSTIQQIDKPNRTARRNTNHQLGTADDLRPAAGAQHQLQAIADCGPIIAQLRSFQDIADRAPKGGSGSAISALQRQSAPNVMQREVRLAGQDFSNMQELSQNNAAWAIYAALPLPARAVLREALPYEKTYDLWGIWAFSAGYSAKSQNDVETRMVTELGKWNTAGGFGIPDFAQGRPHRYDTGYNGNGQANEVVSQDTCDALVNRWPAIVAQAFGHTQTHTAWSNTTGLKTNKRMHDFMVQRDNKTRFNFHIEVERGSPY